MYEVLLINALEKNDESVKRSVKKLASMLGLNESNFSIKEIEEAIDEMVRRYANTDTQLYPLVNILRLYFNKTFDDIWKNPPETLCFFVYKKREEILKNFKILKSKWEKANKEIRSIKGKVLSPEIREFEVLLRLDEEEFKKLLTVFSLIGEIAGKVYNDLEETARKAESWDKLNVEEIKEVENISKKGEKTSLTKFLIILGILGSSLAVVLVICWTAKENFGFLNFFGQAKVRSIGNSTESEKSNAKSIQQKTDKSKRIIQKKENFLRTKNTTTSNSTLSTTKSNKKTNTNETSIGKKKDGGLTP